MYLKECIKQRDLVFAIVYKSLISFACLPSMDVFQGFSAEINGSGTSDLQYDGKLTLRSNNLQLLSALGSN